jgi:hypothetical protein
LALTLDGLWIQKKYFKGYSNQRLQTPSICLAIELVPSCWSPALASKRLQQYGRRLRTIARVATKKRNIDTAMRTIAQFGTTEGSMAGCLGGCVGSGATPLDPKASEINRLNSGGH